MSNRMFAGEVVQTEDGFIFKADESTDGKCWTYKLQSEKELMPGRAMIWGSVVLDPNQHTMIVERVRQ